MMQMIFITIAIIVLPLALFFGVVGLAISIWCWNRIGRYFINFGRWLGSWRNFIPLSILGILSLIFVLVIFPLIGLSSTLIAVLLITLLLVTVVIFLFAIVAWIIRFCQWFWPPYRRLVWSALSSMWGSLPQRSSKSRRRVSKPSSRPTPGGQPPSGKQQPSRGSWLGSFWALMMGKPSEPARPTQPLAPVTEPGTPPLKTSAPVKQSWFASFWALMLGKPAKSAKPKAASVKVRTTEQSLGQSQGIATSADTEPGILGVARSATPKAEKGRPARRSWFGAFWAVMMGKPSKPSRRKEQPEKAKTGDRAHRSTQATASADVKTGVTGTTEAPTAPESGEREKPTTRGRVVQKISEGIEWVRIRLNLD